MTGYIRVKCANCNKEIRTEVDFPKFNQGFTAKQIICVHCGEQIQVFDTHEYNQDGTIK